MTFKEPPFVEERTWGDVFWKHVRLGKPFEEAAYCADEWERQRKLKEKP